MTGVRVKKPFISKQPWPKLFFPGKVFFGLSNFGIITKFCSFTSSQKLPRPPSQSSIASNKLSATRLKTPLF
jgi:hypothetical protein